jgi:rod shape-determining protein MreC
METSREDFGIAVRSAFLRKETKQRFSLFLLVIASLVLLFFDSLESKPISFVRSFVKDTIYRGSVITSSPIKGVKYVTTKVADHLKLFQKYSQLQEDYSQLKNEISKSEFLELENTQLRKLINEQIESNSNLVSSRVMLDKQSPYLNSYVLNSGSNKKIKKGMAVLDGKNFIGRIVDVNFFSSRVLLVTDLNSKIPVVIQPSGHHAILSGHNIKEPTLEYLPEDHKISNKDKVYTSGKEGIFSPGIPIGEVKIEDNLIKIELFSDLNQITFINIKLEQADKNK